MSENNLDFTGERYIPEVHGDIELEHLHRYLFASQFVANKQVLDIASGEGYGSELLAKTAKKVYGVDISKEAIIHARKKYPQKNLFFKVGSCSVVPLKDHSIDVVVSFETIEHHDDHEGMMLEIKRVLKPDGILVISSPDKLEYTDKPGFNNEYHVKELYREEFEALLGGSFSCLRFFGQKVIYGSAILAEEGVGSVASYDLSNNQLESVSGVPAALYLVAVVSDVELPIFENGILEQPINQSELAKIWTKGVIERDGKINELHQTVAERDSKINELHQTVAERDGKINELHQTVAERDIEINELHQTVAERDGQIDTLNQGIAEFKSQLDEIFRSRSWNITAPLRMIKRKLSK